MKRAPHRAGRHGLRRPRVHELGNRSPPAIRPPSTCRPVADFRRVLVQPGADGLAAVDRVPVGDHVDLASGLAGEPVREAGEHLRGETAGEDGEPQRAARGDGRHDVHAQPLAVSPHHEGTAVRRPRTAGRREPHPDQFPHRGPGPRRPADQQLLGRVVRHRLKRRASFRIADQLMRSGAPTPPHSQGVPAAAVPPPAAHRPLVAPERLRRLPVGTHCARFQRGHHPQPHHLPRGKRHPTRILNLNHTRPTSRQLNRSGSMTAHRPARGPPPLRAPAHNAFRSPSCTLRRTAIRLCLPARPRRPGRCRRRSQHPGTYGSTNTAPTSPGWTCRSHRPSGPTALLDSRTCGRADRARQELFGRTGEIGPQRLENLLRNPRLATASIASDAVRATVHNVASAAEGRRSA